MSEEVPRKKAEAGAPSWIMTFADLMSILMCFFVLLLSFSEMDVSKYKQLAGSLKYAFGVQREIKAKEPPKGINVVAREFSPGRPEPTVFNTIRQVTTNELRINLDLGKERLRPVSTPSAENEPDKQKSANTNNQAKELTEAQNKDLVEAKKLAAVRLEQKLKAEQQMADIQAEQKRDVAIDSKSLEELLKAKVAAERLKKLEKSAKLISSALGQEIKSGSIDVETAGQKIIIRVREKASFGSGRADLKDTFRPLLARVARILKDSEGKIIIAGHTDNVPIYTQRFRSNWELSSARAVSVAHEMMLSTKIPSQRFLIQGFADTDPMVENNSAENRAKNRRVEIILQQGEDKESGDLKISQEKLPASGSAGLHSQRQQRQTVSEPVADSTPPPAAGAKPDTVLANPGGIKVGGSPGSDKKPDATQTRPKSAAGLGIRAAGSQ